MLKIIFWLSLFFLLYNYIGYALVTLILVKIGKKKAPLTQITENDELAVTIVIAAYNEEAFIRQKIENTLSLDYPSEKLQIIFITDGSTDKTPEIIRDYEHITLLHQPLRKGKTAALNRAMPFVKNPVVIFCDANTMLNTSCIRELVKHYKDEKVGGVAGEKRVLSGEGMVQQEGLYWKYESYLKKLDASYETVVGAAGELFSFRTRLWTDIEEDSILDDFMLSMRIVQKGYRIMYEPLAYATETASASVKEESKRKVRIAAGGFQSMSRLTELLNVFKYGKAAFLYISHRVLRWAVSPFCLVLILISNIVLAIYSNKIFYQIILMLQLVFYFLAVLGKLSSRVNLKIPLAQPVYYFVFMNICVIRGLFRYLQGKQAATWERAERQMHPKTASR